MTITVMTTDDGTIGCCPCIPAEGMPTVLIVITAGLTCLRVRLDSKSALRLGKALSEAGAYIDPHSADWHDREQELAEQMG